ncbi:unnamed protein product [Schistosoma curassoni]|uniref:Uncharacterized protein n=1 Tax=Schistosoma curassoni TaxID=6186 RepID=A0A183KVD2_9TREM|nr:unnamed protein product [Schistosoma curassoni]
MRIMKISKHTCELLSITEFDQRIGHLLVKVMIFQR